MGHIWKPNKALTITQMISLIDSTDHRVEISENILDINLWSSFLMYACISYVLSLIESDGLLLNVESTFKYKDRNNGSYFTIRLMGCIKGKNNDYVI